MKYTREIDDGKPCDFCELARNKWWINHSKGMYTVGNRAPYIDLKEGSRHTLTCSKKHIKYFWDIPDSHFTGLKKDIKRLYDASMEVFGKGMVFFFRQDTTGQSMEHLHIHGIVDDRWLLKGIDYYSMNWLGRKLIDLVHFFFKRPRNFYEKDPLNEDFKLRIMKISKELSEKIIKLGDFIFKEFAIDPNQKAKKEVMKKIKDKLKKEV
jgi:diadenosine tetraphosphate (Ap4A) HIT family hydrolase